MALKRSSPRTNITSGHCDRISCKHVVRRHHFSQIKARLFWLVENVFFPMKTQQVLSETSARADGASIMIEVIEIAMVPICLNVIDSTFDELKIRSVVCRPF